MTIDEDGDCELCVHGICSAHQVWTRSVDNDGNGVTVDGEMIAVGKWKIPGGDPLYYGISSWTIAADVQEGRKIEIAVGDSSDCEGYATVELSAIEALRHCERIAKLAKQISTVEYERFMKRLRGEDPWTLDP